MVTLGINAAYHDSAAYLVGDGPLIAAAQEERFTRIRCGKRPVRFSAWLPPYHALDCCLAEAGLHLCDIDRVAYSYRPSLLHHAASLPATISPHLVNAPRQLAGGAPHPA